MLREPPRCCCAGAVVAAVYWPAEQLVQLRGLRNNRTYDGRGLGLEDDEHSDDSGYHSGCHPGGWDY